MSLHLSGA